MGGIHEAPKKRKAYYRTVSVDMDIDESVLEENGFHHEDDCPDASHDIPDLENNRRRLSEWHDSAHGLSLWASCPYQPCKLLTDEFRRTA